MTHPETLALLKFRAYLLESIAQAADEIKAIDTQLTTLELEAKA